MTKLNALGTLLLLVSMLIGRVAAGDDAIEFIPLDDLKLSSTLQVKWCWNTFCYVTGSNVKDTEGNLYFAVHAGKRGLMKVNVEELRTQHEGGN